MKKLLAVLGILLVLIGSSLGYIYYLSSPVSPSAADKNFVVNQGDGLERIADRLKDNGFIRNKYVFMAAAYYLGLNTKIQAGSFRISSSLTNLDLVRRLSIGGSHDYWFQIKDGQRIEEIASAIPPESLVSSKEFIIKANGLEGKLYPDKYLFPQEFTFEDIIKKIQSNFDQKLALAQAESINTSLDANQTLVLASILEREGRSLDSKKMIAGILLNRIAAGMPLQVDASVQYARDSKLPHPKTYWLPISSIDIKLASAFNTYANPGLPPSPICNPGYDSLYAAYHPKDSDYIYYITGDDGKMHYAKTLEEHNSNISKYL